MKYGNMGIKRTVSIRRIDLYGCEHLESKKMEQKCKKWNVDFSYVLLGKFLCNFKSCGHSVKNLKILEIFLAAYAAQWIEFSQREWVGEWVSNT